MKTDFSIQRINLLLRKDWIENKKKLAYGVLVILGVLFFLPVILHFMGYEIPYLYIICIGIIRNFYRFL